MSNSSKSTLLLNCLIALSTKTPDFPYPLYEQGFQLENIEPKILLADGRQANPDMQFKKNDNHLTFFECKDGYCEKDQLERYKQMTAADITRSHVTCLPSSNLTFDLAYFGTEEKREKLEASIEQDNNTFPIMILEKNCIRLNPKSQQFKNDALNGIFKELTFTQQIPRSFIPFTVNDDDSTIKIALLQYVMSKVGSSFTMDDLINDLFAHVVHHYSTDAKKELKERIGRLLREISRSTQFSEYLQITDHNYVVNSGGTKKFKNACGRFMEDCKLEQEKKANSLEKWF